MRSEARSTISVVDLAWRLPAMIPELPIMAKGVRGLMRTPDAKESIGLVFQRVAAAHPGRTFLKFEGESLSYASANARVNRYAHAADCTGGGETRCHRRHAQPQPAR
jgi:fatty-acyl-CoA synthase